MLWLAGDDPGKMKEFDKLPLLEYFIIVDKKISETKKQMAKQK